MSLIFHYPRYQPSLFDDLYRLDRLQSQLCPSVFDSQETEREEGASNSPDKFEVSLNVSSFKPGELKVNLEGRVLTVEGLHESQDDHGSIQRSFTRKWILPKHTDFAAVRSQLKENGVLTIEAPKKTSVGARSIEIETQ